MRGHQEKSNYIMHSASMILMGTILLVLVILNRFYSFLFIVVKKSNNKVLLGYKIVDSRAVD